MSYRKLNIHFPILILIIIVLSIVLLALALVSEEGAADSLDGTVADLEGASEKLFKVIVKHHDLYAVWPADEQIPDGWKNAGFTGTEQECQNYVASIAGTDVRALSPSNLSQMIDRETLVRE